MPLAFIHNVRVFDSRQFGQPTTVAFVNSPGDIVSTDYGDVEPLSPEVTIDGTGCTLIPALIDANIDAAAASGALEAFARHGISTVIDMSSTPAEIRAMRAAAAADPGLPSFLACGTVAAGSQDGSEETEPGYFPIRASAPVLAPQAADAFVAERVHGPERADYIKVMVDSPSPDDQTLAALVNSAHLLGRLAIGHASREESYRRALEAAFDIILHVPVDAPLDPALAAELAARRVVVVPTLCVMRRVVDRMREAGDGPPADFDNCLASVRVLHEAGVTICAGTGANRMPGREVPFGESLHDELELLVRAGMSHEAALRAATCVCAESFGLKGRGRVERGHCADLLLIRGNPLEDIRATRRIERVWIKGIEVVHAG